MTRTSKDPSATEWIKVRLAEMDAAIDVIETRSEQIDSAMRRQASEYLQGALKARQQLADTAQTAIDQNRASLPQLRGELEPVWTSFEQSVKLWTHIGASQDELIGAQLKAQTAAWDSFFDECRKVVANPFEQTRSMLIDHIDRSARQVTEFQMKVAASENAPWDVMTDALEQSRKTAEDAALQIQKALLNAKS